MIRMLSSFKRTEQPYAQLIKYTAAVVRKDLIEKQFLEQFAPDRERYGYCFYDFYAREEAEEFFNYMHSNKLTVCKYYI